VRTQLTDKLASTISWPTLQLFGYPIAISGRRQLEFLNKIRDKEVRFSLHMGGDRTPDEALKQVLN
jgi:hypothetical protein